MKKLLLLPFIFLTACVCQSSLKEETCTIENFHNNFAEKNLISYSQTYMNYLKKVGKSSAEKVKNIPHPFDSQSQKIINGELVVKNAEEFVTQLSELRKLCKFWDIKILEILPSPSSKNATILYTIKAAPLGTFIVIAITSFDNFGNVRKVNEVFSLLKEEHQMKKEKKK